MMHWRMRVDMNRFFRILRCLAIAIVLGYILLVLFSPGHPPGPRIASCREYLQYIYAEITLYKGEYGIWPEKLDILPQFSSDRWADRWGGDFEYFLFCPGGSRERYYQYDPEGQIEFQGKTPILWDNNRDNHTHRYWHLFPREAGNVLFKDGSVKTLKGRSWDIFIKKVEDIGNSANSESSI